MSFVAQDSFEAFLLDFLSYRRSKKSVPVINQNAYTATPLLTDGIKIGKGWPYYRDAALPYTASGDIKEQRNDTPHTNKAVNSGHEIVHMLEPIVRGMVERFGAPDNPRALTQLNHQVIAKAMSLPLVEESIRTDEAHPLGRVSLLQAVVELMILLKASQKQSAIPES